MGRTFLLSLLAAFNPTLLAVTTLMLVLSNPARLMLGYLLGAAMTSITLGLIIVFTLEGGSTVSTTQRTLSPSADIALGVLAFVAAQVFARVTARRASHPKPAKTKAPPRWQTYLSHGSPRGAFLVGALLTLPGASYIAGLLQIDRGGYAVPVTVLAIIGFNVVMLGLLELPLLGFLVAPDWTQGRVTAARALISRRGRQIAIVGLRVIGIALVLKGVVGLITG